MKSIIHYPTSDSLRRALEHPKAVRHNNGYTWAKHTDGTIYKVGPQTNGLWPIMYEVNRGQDNYRFVHELFLYVSEHGKAYEGNNITVTGSAKLY